MHITETDLDAAAVGAETSTAAPARDTPAPAARRGLTLRVRGLQRAADRDGALRGLGFDVGAGEIVALVGARGSGVELLARVLAGELPFERGELLFDGRVPPAGSREVHLQHRHGRMLGWRLWLLQRALRRSPRLLLLDRSFEGLDALQRVRLKQRIEAHWLQQRCTTLLFTHDLRDALALADRVLRIDGGRLVGDEPLALARPRVFSGDEQAAASWGAGTACGTGAAHDEPALGPRAAGEILRYPF